MRLTALLHSRVLLVLGTCVAVAIPILTLPRIPDVSPWPALLGLIPWTVGKYLMCPLRWRAVTNAGLSRTWHIRAYAESELLGLLTPGHIGADVWRAKRLTMTGMGTGDAIASVGLDRLVGAIGLTAFVAIAGTTLPLHLVLIALGFGAAVLLAVVFVGRLRPSWVSPSGFRRRSVSPRPWSCPSATS